MFFTLLGEAYEEVEELSEGDLKTEGIMERIPTHRDCWIAN